MTPSFDIKPLRAFFEEVKDQMGISLKYHPENTAYPIQIDLSEHSDGLSKAKCIELLQFIKTQTDLREGEIGKIHPSKATGKFLFEMSHHAAKALADVYALSFFIPQDEQEEEPPKGNNPLQK